jgi:hypothetical protein
MCLFLMTALFASPLLPGLAQKKADSVPPADLPSLLKRAAEYCQKLEGAGLNFVCREEIRETIDPLLDVRQRQVISYDWAWAPRNTMVMLSSPRKIKNSYVYDYQCIRSGGAIREVRILLKENGQTKHESDARLKTSVVVFGTALLGPVGLFGERFQPQYDYAAIGQDRIGKRPVIIIDARPKPGAPETRNLYGKAWVDPVTADILKIEWSESRVGRHEVFDKRGELFQRTPRLTIRSEFSAEKNGIRFPSHLIVEEAYLGKSGRPFVRSKTDVAYADFKFFTVEVEVGL